ncbi:hypothetical protein AB0K92_27360 [Streptomyces sp. NPDC052687]|uniref:hypothetical protein n=1 Tax=Streptomyces sp. NPDC052687 TaxID=3154759 RepID=UPI00341C0355
MTWIIGVIALAFVGFRFGAATDNDFTGGDSGSAKAQALIEKHFPEQQGDTLTLAIKAEKGIDDPAAREKIEKVIAELDAFSVTGPVTSPYDDEKLVTEDRPTRGRATAWRARVTGTVSDADWPAAGGHRTARSRGPGSPGTGRRPPRPTPRPDDGSSRATGAGAGAGAP